MFRATRVVLPSFVLAVFGLHLVTLAVEPSVAGDPHPSIPTVDQTARAQSQLPKLPDEVLVTVNGTLLGDADVDFALRGGHGEDRTPPRRRDILEHLIQQELARQKAVELGLDADPGFREKLRPLEAQIDAFKRRELSELFFRHETAKQVEVSEAEAKRYFVENSAGIRTELHVWQILLKKEGLAVQALNEIQQGASFEEVAGRQFPNVLRNAQEPWDLGYLRWTQVPESWRNVVYGLKKGEVSGVIRGPNKRFWIIKLIERRENSDITFESMSARIIENLKNAKIEGLREKTDRDLRAKASIVYAEDPLHSGNAPLVTPDLEQLETPRK